MIDNTKSIVQDLISSIKKDDIIALDMTCGNGHDSKFILDTLKVKKLFAFDIQEISRKNSLETIGNFPNNFQFILDSHANLDKYVKEKVDLAIFNLGYLPKADKSITTNYTEVLKAIEKLFELLNKDALIIITLYPGHLPGQEEAEKIEEFLIKLDQKDYSILKYNFLNQKNKPPYVIRIQKKV